MENQLLKLLKNIDFNIANYFFLQPEYLTAIEKYEKEKYPYKYEEKIEYDYNPFLDSDINWDDKTDPFETENINTKKESLTTENEEYTHKPDNPDIDKFINLWYYDPEKKSSLNIEFFIKLKLDFIYHELNKLTIEQQKGIILFIFQFVRKAIGGQDLIFLKNYFKNKFPNSWQDHYGDMKAYKKRAGNYIYRDLIEYYCKLLEGNIDTRIIITQKEYIAFLGHLKLIERGKLYEIQAKNAIDLIDNHIIFTKFRLILSKEITVLSYIKHYFSDPDKFKLKPEFIHILKELN